VPEGAAPLPRWDGPLKAGSLAMTIAVQEVRRSLRSFWVQMVFIAIFAYIVGNLSTVSGYTEVDHTWANFWDYIDWAPWFALAVAAVLGGPAILEDVRRGSLELYLSRSVSRTDYLAGKIIAVLGLSTLTVLVIGGSYIAFSYTKFNGQPEGWPLAPVVVLGFAIVWGLLVSGLALGLSCVARSGPAAILILIGGTLLLHFFADVLLANITRNPDMKALSPVAVVQQFTNPWFKQPSEWDFPAEWAFVIWLGLVLIGWGLVAWRHPRVRGEERALG
jgi:ABC-type transport system involved in multi-copper enzyme maturation permease subunit